MTDCKYFKIGGYSVTSVLGKGSYANVYTILDGKKEKKALRISNDDGRDTMYTGLDIMTRLRHPNIMTGVIVPQREGVVMMEKADSDISTWLDTKPSVSDRLDVAFKICCAVAFLHKQHYLHLDISYGNVLMKGKEPIVIDFDFSTRLDDTSKIHIVNQPVTTNVFRAIETFGNRISCASDVWSLGALIQYIFSGMLMGCSEADPPNLKESTNTLIKRYIRKWYEEPIQRRHTLRTFIDVYNERDNIIDLLMQMFEFDPVKRITMDNVLAHPVFGGRKYIDGFVINIPTLTLSATQPTPEAFQIFKRQVNVMVDTVSSSIPICILFLAVDLLYRTADVGTLEKIEAWVVACHRIASLYYRILMPGCETPVELFTTDKEIQVDVPAMEHRITCHLEGLIYRQYIYDTCASEEQLMHAVKNILFEPNKYLEFTPASLNTITGTTEKDKIFMSQMSV